MNTQFSIFKHCCYWWFQLTGWQLTIPEQNWPPHEEPQKYVILVAPHTSNWDFVIGIAAAYKLQFPVRFTIKKEWMIFPFRRLMQNLGAIPIDRRPAKDLRRHSMVDEMSTLLRNAQNDLFLVVTPEATRKRRDHWKTGFYHIAVAADVPILLGFLDYKTKRCGIAEVFHPTGNMEQDMRSIMRFYQTVNPKYPELFSVDKRY